MKRGRGRRSGVSSFSSWGYLRYADSLAPYGDYGSSTQGFFMFVDQLGDQSDAPFRGNVWKSDKPRMRNLVQVDKRPEVGVNCHENPPFGRGLLQ